MPTTNQPTGYVPCACRDCFETAIGVAGEALCHECEEHGCEAGAEQECCSPNAYGGEAEEADSHGGACDFDGCKAEAKVGAGRLWLCAEHHDAHKALK